MLFRSVEGWNEDWFIIDIANNSNCCKVLEYGYGTVTCTHQIVNSQITDNPSIVSKLRFTATTADCNKDNYFSLTQLELFGFWGAKNLLRQKEKPFNQKG